MMSYKKLNQWLFSSHMTEKGKQIKREVGEFRTGGERIVAGHDSFGRAFRRMLLPSGRTLVYRGIRATQDRWGRPSVAFWDARRSIAVETFGGRLTESLVQAVARDCLASAMVRLDRAGFEIVAHVHDEVLIKGPSDWWDYAAGRPSPAGVEAFRKVRDVMSSDLPWAPGLHLRAAGPAEAGAGRRAAGGAPRPGAGGLAGSGRACCTQHSPTHPPPRPPSASDAPSVKARRRFKTRRF